MSEKHTPGPWQFVSSTEYGYSLLWNPKTGQDVLETNGCNNGDFPITWMGESMKASDKALIEAAPDLLAALRRCLNYIENTEGSWGIKLSSGDAARAAIARATGEAP